MNANVLKKFLVLSIVCLSQLTAQAETGAERHYAVLSLIGDNFTIVYEATATGTNIERNKQEDIPVPGTVFDGAALMAADAAIGKVHAAAKKDLLISNDAGLYRMQGSLFGSGADADVVLEGLKLALKNSPAATHLILVTKHRGEAKVSLRHEVRGRGKLEGLGFYIDNSIGILREDTKETGTGMIAPYAYMTVRLIDTRNWTVIREKTMDNSTTFANAGNREQTMNAWEALTAKEKEIALKQLIRETLGETVEEVLADKPA